MEILENIDQWETQFKQGWLAHYQATGQTDWSQYIHPRNEHVPGTKGVKLAQSCLMLVSTAGGYIPNEQAPFDTPNLLGDYTLRTFPSTINLDKLAFAHEHYNHEMIDQDAQIALPLNLLNEMVTNGRLAALTRSIISISGYHPDSAQVAREVAPQVVALAKEEAANAVLLAPL